MAHALSHHALFSKTIGSVTLSNNSRAIIGDIYGNPALQINHASFYFVLPNGALVDAISVISALGGQPSSQISDVEDEISSLSSAFSNLNFHDDDCIGCFRCDPLARRNGPPRNWDQHSRNGASRFAMELRARGQAPHSPSMRVIQAAESVQFTERLLTLVESWMSCYVTQDQCGIGSRSTLNGDGLVYLTNQIGSIMVDSKEAPASLIADASKLCIQQIRGSIFPSHLIQVLALITPGSIFHGPEVIALVWRILLRTFNPEHELDHIFYKIITLFSTSFSKDRPLNVPFPTIIDVFTRYIHQSSLDSASASEELAFAYSCAMSVATDQRGLGMAAELLQSSQTIIEFAPSKASFNIQDLKYMIAVAYFKLGNMEMASALFEDVRLTYTSDFPFDNEFNRGLATVMLGKIYANTDEDTCKYLWIDGLKWMLRAVQPDDKTDLASLFWYISDANEQYPEEVTKLRCSFADIFAILEEKYPRL